MFFIGILSGGGNSLEISLAVLPEDEPPHLLQATILNCDFAICEWQASVHLF